MSVEPVTVTITTEIESGDVLHHLVRVKAAEELGLETDEMFCVDVGAVIISRPAVHEPDIEPVLSEPDPETGAVTVLQEGQPGKLITPAEYSLTSTFRPAHVSPKRALAPPIPWPDVKLSRGAKWHGLIPGPDGEPIEAMLISDGTKLVLLDGPEGQAVLAEIGGEKPVSSTVAGNSFG